MKQLSAAAQKYADLAAQGYSQSTTASILGVSRETVCLMAKKYLIKFESGHSDADRDDRIIAIHGRGLTCSEISREIGCCYASICLAVKRLGLTPNKKRPYSKHAAALIACAEAGLTGAEAAARLGMGRIQVYRIAARLGIKFTDGRKRKGA
jgi:transposase